MAIKVTWFFSVRDVLGFSESWINDSTSDPNAYDLAKIRATSVLRMKLGGRQTMLEGIRVSSTTNPRLVRVYTSDVLLNVGCQMAGSFTAGPGVSVQSDFGDTALQLRKGYGAPIVFSGQMFLRGIPDAVVDRGGQFVDAGGFAGDLTAWANNLNLDQWGWYERRANYAGNPATITNAVQDPADGTVTFTLAGTPFLGLPLNSRQNATIRGQVLPPTLNGRLVVVITGNNTCRSLRFLPLGPFAGGSGRMNIKADPRPRQISAFEIVRVTERKGGRPIGLYRGRSKGQQAV